MTDAIVVRRLGLIDYRKALSWQRETVAAVSEGSAPETLALLQHPPVYTVGARGGRKNLLVAPALLEQRGAEIIDCDRGGDVTFHGPGQLVVYPIIDLRRRRLGPASYVRALESTVIAALQRFDVTGERRDGCPGIWVDGAKVAALGVRIQRGITSHGVALNVSTDLNWFDAIVPCGLPGSAATSLERLLGIAPDQREVEDEFAAAFAEVFDCRLVDVEPSARRAEEAVVGVGG